MGDLLDLYEKREKLETQIDNFFKGSNFNKKDKHYQKLLKELEEVDIIIESFEEFVNDDEFLGYDDY